MIKFGTDLDDCSLATAARILKVLGRPGEKIYNSISRYSIEECLNIPLPIVEKAIDIVLNMEDIEYMHGVREYLPKIHSLVDEFSIITLRYEHMRPNIERIIKDIFGNTAPKPIELWLAEKNKNGIPNKADIVRELDLDFYVEDRYSTALDIVKNTDCKVFLFDKPWNRYRRYYHGMTRVYSWREIYENLIEMRNEK